MSSLFGSTRNTRFLKGGSLDGQRYVRSDAPDKLCEEEIQWLIDHNIVTVIDLRQEHEVAAKPCALSGRAEFRYDNIPVTSLNALPASPELVAPSYLQMVDDTMHHLIETIESADTGVLYFCAAGKDRTGVVSALLLKRAGASRQVIVDDYTATYENLKDLIEQWRREGPAFDIDIVIPHACYMEGFLDGVEF
jgi:protein-tyrosine phosphatase